jgi:hypothetical protein
MSILDIAMRSTFRKNHSLVDRVKFPLEEYVVHEAARYAEHSEANKYLRALEGLQVLSKGGQIKMASFKGKDLLVRGLKRLETHLDNAAQGAPILPKPVRDFTSLGKEKLRGGVDFLAGVPISEMGSKHIRNNAAREEFLAATTYKDRRRIFEREVATLSYPDPKALLSELDALHKRRMLAQGALGGTIAVGVGAKLHSDAQQNALEREALNYYRQRGLYL